MPDTRAPYGDLVAAVAEAAEAGRREHPESEELIDLQAGALAPEAEDRLRDHLAACRRCAQRYLELEPLAEPDAPTAEGVADLELAAAWRAMRARIETESAGARPAGDRWLRPAAAALAVLAVGLGAWSLYLLDRVERLEAPQINPPVLYLDEPERAGGGLEPEVVFGSGKERATVFLTPPVFEAAGPQDTAYEVELATAGGRTLRTYRGFRRSDAGTLRFELPRLEPGSYRARLAVQGDARAELLGEYPFTVRWEGVSPEP